MTRYTADIGCWKKGKMVDLPNSHTVDGAIVEAHEVLTSYIENGKLPSDSFVVQIRNKNGLVVWDYINGNLMY